jgi:hypothetical protein
LTGRLPEALAVLSCLAVLAPLLSPGYVLSYDMVFLPRLPWTGAVLGLGSQPPRAVPSDALVAAASGLVSGQLLQKLILAALLLSAGIGASRLPLGSVLARVATGLAYLWTPMLAERLVIGQWAVLTGYATAPWLVRYGLAVRRDLGRPPVGPAGRLGSWWRLVAVLGLCCCGGAPSWLIAALILVPLICWPAGTALLRARSARWADAGRLLLALAVYALPWAVPGLTRPGGVSGARSGLEAFAARSDTKLGLLGSLLTGGGIWNAEVTAPGRGSIGYALGALLLLAVVAFGLVRLRRQPWLPPLALAALLGLLIALPLPGLAAGLSRLPGGGLFRDGERFLVGWVLLAAIGFGAGVEAIAERLRPASVLLAGLPVVLLPGLAWGVSGALAPVHYPADYSAVSRLIDSDPRPGAVLVLPFTAYRHYSYDAGRTQLDPLPRWLDRTVIASADLPVRIGDRQLLVPGEDRLASRAAQLLAGPDATDRLAAIGVRWVVVDAGDAEPQLPVGLRPVFAGATLRVYELAGVDPARARHPTAGYAPPALPTVLADLVAAGLLVGSLCAIGIPAIRHRVTLPKATRR